MNNEYYNSEEQDFWEGPACPICAGPPVHLGLLGNQDHWTCRNCGMQHSTLRHEEVA